MSLALLEGKLERAIDGGGKMTITLSGRKMKTVTVYWSL